MKRTVQYAKNPKFINLEKTAIDIIVKFEEVDEEIPFTASSYDSMAYGVELYNRVISGEFGKIEEFDNSCYLEILAANVRFKRNELLSSTDWTQAADIPQTLKQRYTPYRQALRDLPQQEGFPESITWPEVSKS